MLETRCKAGTSNGFLDPGEECDDGNEDDGDGCSLCRVECPGVKDPSTSRCYFLTAEAGTAVVARDACRATGAGLVTVRTAEERALVAGLVAGQEAHTAYALSTYAGETTQLSYAGPEPISLYREPGVLLASSPLKLVCPGCYGGEGLSFTKGGDRLIATASGAFRVGSAAEVLRGVCERAPAGSPQNLCPGSACLSGAVADLFVDGRRYAYFPTPAPFPQAEARCRDAGGHVVWFESERERERVLHHFSFVMTTDASWLGLSRSASGWTWTDGTPDGAGRPRMWAYEALLPQLSCAVIQHAPLSYSTGLALPIPCAGKVTQPKVDGALPYLCKL